MSLSFRLDVGEKNEKSIYENHELVYKKLPTWRRETCDMFIGRRGIYKRTNNFIYRR